MSITVVGHNKEPNSLFICSNEKVLKALKDDLEKRHGEPAASVDLDMESLSFDEGGSVFGEQDWHEITFESGRVFKFMPHQFNSLQFKLGAALRTEADYIVLESWYRSLCLEKSEGQQIMRALIDLQSDLESRASNHFERRQQLAEILKADKKNVFVMAEHVESDPSLAN